MNLLRITPLVLSAALLGGCAGLSNVSSEVSTYGGWPAGRAPGTYAFERLPSQETLAAESEALEAAAAPALAKAGFKPVADGQQPEVLVQVGARYQRSDDDRWDDRLWWSGGVGFGYGGYWRRGPFWSPRFSLAYSSDFRRFDREVALLIRDRASGKPLYEARATNEGMARQDPTIQAAMFEAALTDFPKVGLNPRRVSVALPATP